MFWNKKNILVERKYFKTPKNYIIIIIIIIILVVVAAAAGVVVVGFRV
jgi:flagellar basal body-associated protein FliL